MKRPSPAALWRRRSLDVLTSEVVASRAGGPDAPRPWAARLRQLVDASRRAEGGPSWKGLFIAAKDGQEVRSIAPGRVVFADWLRGFGNLLIVDHGGGYMSLYGNNDSLYRQVGDMVKAGDPIAAVGATGGNPQTGLYFELRFQGKPFDPLSWVTLK